MDLNNLTLTQIVLGLLALTVADFVSGAGMAIVNHTFSVHVVADFISLHILGRVIPLSFLAAIGVGIPQIGLAGIPAVFAIFLAGGAAYVAETLASIATNVGQNNATPAVHANPNPTSPVA